MELADGAIELFEIDARELEGSGAVEGGWVGFRVGQAPLAGAHAET